MGKLLKRTLTGIVSAAMITSSLAVPMAASADTDASLFAAGDVKKFDFGVKENVADGYIGVSSTDEYSAAAGYGFLGLTDGYALDARTDGWTMTQGYDLVLADGARETVAAADDDFVATTTRKVDTNGQKEEMVSPIRFAVKVDANTYYKVKIKLQRADTTKEAKVNLFTEKRHQHLINKDIPAEGLEYETSVYVHNNWSKNTGEYVDTMLNIVAEGDNVAISSVEIEQTEPGKTLWVLGDSTVCEQTASIPYFPLQQCMGVASLMPKYLGSDWALVNEAESGLSASAAKNHLNNFINDVKEGDMVWFEFGHNDDKVTSDPSTNGYLSSLETYYTQITAKGANFVVVSPIERTMPSQFSSTTDAETGKITPVWTHSLSHYTTAAKKFVEDKIAAGATNIAFVDLNTPALDFLKEVSTEILNTEGCADYGVLSARFYYYVNKSGANDYTHPNDAGADNFASMVVNGAKEIIAADADSVQAKVLNTMASSFRDETPYRVPAEIYTLGTAPNSAYRNAFGVVVKYEYPLILQKVTFDEYGCPVSVVGKNVDSDTQYVYGRAVVDIYNADGTKKATFTSKDYFDKSGSEIQTLTFDAAQTTKASGVTITTDTDKTVDIITAKYDENGISDIKVEPKVELKAGEDAKYTKTLADGERIFIWDSLESAKPAEVTQTMGEIEVPVQGFDADAGDTYKVYTLLQDEETGVIIEPNVIISTTLTEQDNLDVKEYLMQGSKGTENVEDFSSYSTSVAVGDSLVSNGGWNTAGSVKAVLGNEGDKYFATISKEDTSSSHYLYKALTKEVKSGQIAVKMDVRYRSGIINMELTNGAKAPNSFPPLILPIVVKSVDNVAGVYLDGELVTTINAGDWTTIQYVLDMDYGTHTATVNGKTLKKDIAGFQVNTDISPNTIKHIAFVETTKAQAVDYDLTNLIVATLNTAELPERTVKASAKEGGTISATGAAGSEVALPVTGKMNTFYTLKAETNDGYKFIAWKNTADDSVASYAPSYTVRAFTDIDVYADFEVYTGPELILSEDGTGNLDKEIVGGASIAGSGSDVWTFSGNTWGFMSVANSASKWTKLSGMTDKDGNFMLFAGNGGNSTFTGTNKAKSLEGAGVFTFDMSPLKDYSNEGTKHRGTDNVDIRLKDTDGSDVMVFAYDAKAFTLSLNGEVIHTFASADEAQKWTNVKAEINADHTSADVTFTFTGVDEPVTKTIALTKTGSYNQIQINTTGWGAVGLDNLQLYVTK